MLMALLVPLLASCNKETKTIVITNPVLEERLGEMVEVPADRLGLTAEAVGNYALTDKQGNNVPYQVMFYGQDTPQSIIFQASVRGGMRAAYHWGKGTPATPDTKVYARYIPERKDDFAWENEHAAYRMYGPALAPENPSNGVDLWLKGTDELIVDSFYYRERELGLSYHINWGKGLDCYKVGHTLGCGGVAPYVDGQLLVDNHYNTWQIIDQGPLRVRFCLTYDNMTLTITADAGAQLNKAEVVYTGDADTLQMAAGICLHDVLDNVSYSKEGGWAAYAENAVSDAGVPQGRNYAAVVLPETDEVLMQDQSLLCLADYTKGATLTYWFGGGWSQWHYPTDADWFTATAATAHFLTHPLQITVE